jgi:tetratricopeptide (TPR) repeat protein
MRGWSGLAALGLGLWVLAAHTAVAADKEHLAMLASAQAAFGRVASAGAPTLADASACVQTQAAVLSVALPPEETDLHFRKGFCQLVVASMTHAQAAFGDAAAELDQGDAKMLAWIARRVGKLPDPPNEAAPEACATPSCQAFVPVAKLWKGWIALQAGDAFRAAVEFDSQPNAVWSADVAGLLAFRGGRYAESVGHYRQALDVWTRESELKDPPLSVRLSPPADIPELLTDLGGAQILAGDPAGAVVTLDRAVEGAPKARAYFLRARAKELTGQLEPALADYNLASRAAFADASGLASGEAHLYRGILLYRRKDYERAEGEFASALNFDITLTLRPDASAWRHLSAVEAGSCGASRDYLERALGAVSPYFPKAEAETAIAGCRAGLEP